MSEVSVKSSIGSLTTSNTADFIYDNAANRPEHVAVRRRIDGQWHDVTSRQFADEVTGVARGLIAAGIAAGDRVAVMSKTRYEWTVADFALFAVGAVVVPIYETSSAEQVHWILSDSGAVGIFVETPEHSSLVESVRAECPDLAHVWQFDAGDLDTLVTQGESVDAAEVDTRRRAVSLDDLASIIYTSGTTGRPKGCRLLHSCFVHEVLELQDSLSSFFNDQTSTLLFLPIAHVFGRVIEIGALANGCTLGHTGDVKNLLDDLADFKPTFVLAVPRVFEKVYNTAKHKADSDGKGKIFDKAAAVAIAYSEALDNNTKVPLKTKALHAVFDKLVYGKLRAALGGQCVAAVSGGAPLGARLGHFFRGIGVTIYEGYGLTETTAGVTINRPDAIKIGTVGKPVPGVSVKVAEDGELLFKAPMVFDAYFNNEEASAEALTDGWFHTGDIGEIDAAGYVRITGRKKELIVTAGGKNVAPAVLEDRVRANWLVGQCLVVGDQQPFIAALITIDPEALPQYLEKVGKPADTPLADVVGDKELLEIVQGAVDDANKAVSKAESIRKFTVLPMDWNEEGGQLTPSMKLKRNVVQKECADEIAEIYSGAPQG